MAKTILLVEDDKSVARMLADVLESEGFTVHSEHDGEAGLRAFLDRSVDLLLLDVLIPKIKGFDLVGQIRELPRGKDLPIVVVSGVYRSAMHRERTIARYGVVEYLDKPIDVARLLAVLRDVFKAGYPVPSPPPLAAAQRPSVKPSPQTPRPPAPTPSLVPARPTVAPSFSARPSLTPPAAARPGLAPASIARPSARPSIETPRPVLERAAPASGAQARLPAPRASSLDRLERARQIASDLRARGLSERPSPDRSPVRDVKLPAERVSITPGVRGGSVSPLAGSPVEVPTRGDVEEVPFARLFGGLASRSATGVLLLRRGTVKKIVYLRNGAPVFVKSNLLSECLGRIMVAERLISVAECERSLEKKKLENIKQGEALVKMGSISPLNLEFALETQLRTKLFELFSWLEGRFQFVAKDGYTGPTVAMPETPAALVYEGASRTMSPERIRRELGLLDHLIVATPRDLALRMQALELEPRAERMVERIDGRRTLGQLLEQSDFDRDGAALLLYSLWCGGLLRVIGVPRKVQPAHRPVSRPRLELEPEAMVIDDADVVALGTAEVDVRAELARAEADVLAGAESALPTPELVLDESRPPESADAAAATLTDDNSEVLFDQVRSAVAARDGERPSSVWVETIEGSGVKLTSADQPEEPTTEELPILASAPPAAPPSQDATPRPDVAPALAPDVAEVAAAPSPARGDAAIVATEASALAPEPIAEIAEPAGPAALAAGPHPGEGADVADTADAPGVPDAMLADVEEASPGGSAPALAAPSSEEPAVSEDAPRDASAEGRPPEARAAEEVALGSAPDGAAGALAPGSEASPPASEPAPGSEPSPAADEAAAAQDASAASDGGAGPLVASASEEGAPASEPSPAVSEPLAAPSGAGGGLTSSSSAPPATPVEAAPPADGAAVASEPAPAHEALPPSEVSARGEGPSAGAKEGASGPVGVIDSPRSAALREASGLPRRGVSSGVLPRAPVSRARAREEARAPEEAREKVKARLEADAAKLASERLQARPSVLPTQKKPLRAREASRATPPQLDERDLQRMKRELTELDERQRGLSAYEVLGVVPAASDAELRSAFDVLSRDRSPDKLVPLDAPRELRAVAESIALRIRQAFETLSDPDARRVYDSRADGTGRVAALLLAERAFQRGRTARDANQLDAAYEAFAAAVELAPKEGLYLAHLGATAHARDPRGEATRAEALARLDAAVALSPNLEEVLLARAVFHQRTGGRAEAIRDFEATLALNADCVVALRALKTLDPGTAKKGGLLSRLSLGDRGGL